MRNGCFFIGLLSLMLPGYALFNGSPNLPELPEENLFLEKDAWYSWKIAYRGDFILGRKSHAPNLDNVNMRAMFNGAELSLGVIDRVEIYTDLGACRSSVHAVEENKQVKLKTSQSFAGSIGARAMAVSWGETKMGFVAEYFYGWPGLSSLQVGENIFSSYKESRQRQWQVAILLSQRFGFLTPYIGGSYSRFLLQFSGLPSSSHLGTIKIKNSTPYGACVGIALAGRKGVFFDAEASFFSEYTLSSMLGLRF